MTSEKIVFLNFNEKLPSELLQSQLFFRLTNLEDQNPLVQVNDLIFKGDYEYSVGTNLFFKKSPNAGPMEFPFKEASTVKLDFAHSETKILNCKQMTFPSTAKHQPSNSENIKFNFNFDYEEVLKKFESGTLDLQDMILEEGKQNENKETNKNQQDIEIEEKMNISVDLEEIENKSKISMTKVATPTDQEETEHIDKEFEDLTVAYEKLQILARTPLRSQVVDENVVCHPQYQKEYDYKSIECKVLTPPIFSYFNQSKSEDISNHVDLDRCVLLGLLSSSDSYPRILSETELKKIMTIENFENLDLVARHSVFSSHMEELEKQIKSNSSEQNSAIDEFGRTPVETLEIFQKLVSALKRKIVATS